MPYDQTFRELVIASITNLQGAGQLYRRRRHTLEMVMLEYTHKMQTKYTIFGSTILERFSNHVQTIFQLKDYSSISYELLDFIQNVIKWYFKSLTVRRDKATGQVIHSALPDYTIPEIQELFYTISK